MNNNLLKLAEKFPTKLSVIKNKIDTETYNELSKHALFTARGQPGRRTWILNDKTSLSFGDKRWMLKLYVDNIEYWVLEITRKNALSLFWGFYGNLQERKC